MFPVSQLGCPRCFIAIPDLGYANSSGVLNANSNEIVAATDAAPDGIGNQADRPAK
jgi:hypothetical protein